MAGVDFFLLFTRMSAENDGRIWDLKISCRLGTMQD